MKLPRNIEALGKIIAFGFGPDVLKGFIPAYLAKIDLDSCLDYINNDKDLLASVSEEDWVILKKVANAAKLEISTKSVMNELEKTRPDLWAIIYNTPGGLDWIDRQLTNCRQKLGVT
jgi:hypothetical protein